MNYYDYGYPSYGSSSVEAGFSIGTVIYLFSIFAVCIFSIVCMWRIFKKAGKNGWEAIVPVYNIIVLLEIVELPVWYIALFMVPFGNIYAIFKIYIELAHKFGKSTGFGVAMTFCSIVCLPILAFGNNSYNGSVSYQQSMQSQNYTPNQGLYNNGASVPYQQPVQPQNNVPSYKFCPKCGIQNDVNATVCFSCGNNF